MIAWTTPTVPLIVTGGNILDSNVRVEITIAQDCHSVTVEPISMTASEDGVHCEIYLGQLQTGGFHAGIAHVQANVIDSNDYRAASLFADVMIGSNLLPKVVTYA